MMEPSEEILKALDEIVDVNLEEVGRRRVGKRSSILKQPRLDDEQTEDFQKRKSLTSKRRVSFADKFQVMELCTGNVYDVPGRNISASDSALSGDSKSVPEPEISKKDAVDFAISKNEIKASSITEVVLTESENKSLSFAKKHKISFDKNAEPESKKINIEETNSPLNLDDSIFKHQEKLMSECKNFLFGSTDVIDEVKDQNVKLTSVENVVTKISGTYDALQGKDVEEKICDLTCSKIPSPNKSNSAPIPESVTCKSASISKHMVNDYDLKDKLNFENKNSYDLENQIDPKRWASRVEVLPISLSDVPLEENKENIFVDVKNKNVLVTNVRDLKLKEKLPLKLSQVSKHLGSQIEKTNSFSVNKVLQSKENFPPKSVKDITNKQNEKSFVNKTCMLNPSMELTCFPSYMDVAKKLENLINDDYIKNDERQLNKTCMNTSDFMDLTCNVQNLTDSLSPAVSKVCEGKKQFISDVDVKFTEKSYDKNKSIVTCNANNLSDNLSITIQTDNTKKLITQYTDISSDKKRENVSVNRNSQTKYFSSFGMELTCNVKDSTNLKICDMDLTKKLEFTTNNTCIENDEHQSNKTCIDTSHLMELTCNVQNLTDSLSSVSNICGEKKHITNLGVELTEKSFDQDVSGIENAMNMTCCVNNINSSDKSIISMEAENTKQLSTQFTDFSSNERRNRYSQTKYFSYCGMELTCDVKDNTNLKINDHTSDQPDKPQGAKYFFSNNAKNELNKGVNQYEGISKNSAVHSFVEAVDLALLDPEKEDLNSVQDNEKTRFMCDEMELTCYDKNISHEDEVSDVLMHCVSNISEKDNQALVDKLIEEDYGMNGKSLVSNKTQHFSSDYMELTSRTYSGETNLNSNLNHVTKSNEDSVFCLQKTKYFSSYGMDLTCDLQNENDSLIDVGLNSPSDQIYNNESIRNVDIRSDSNVANANKYIGHQSYENNKSEKEPRCIRNSLTNINLATVVVDKKSDSNCDSPSKSHSSCSKQDIESVKTDFHAQNLDVWPISNSIKSPKPFKRDNISDKDHEFEPDNKVAKLSNFIEPGIVYAIKQVKGVNQASPNDYNIFKFPEVFFPLKKTLKPKTSFSCSRIQLTKAVREAIRKSCSFSYAPKDWSPEFSERDTTFKNKLSKTPIKINKKSTTQSVKSSKFPDTQCTPQILGSWSRTKTIKETVHVYPDIVITENTPLPKANISINKDGSFSISNISPDTMNCLRKSLDFNDEINSPRLIISHVREESVIENTAVVTTAANDSFPDSSKFCLDSSISLVPNDDTFSSMSLKLNSEAVNELGSTNCLNPSFDQLKAISLRDVDALNSPKVDIKTLTPTNSMLKECVIQEEVTEDDITQSALAQHYEKNQGCLPHRNSIALLKQKKMNQFLELSKDVPNEEIENSNDECNRKSSYLLSSKNDRNNCSHLLEENQKTPKLKEFVMAQIQEPQESSKKHEQTPNKRLDQTCNKGLDQTLNKGLDQTLNKGLNQTVNKGSDQTLNKGSDQTLDQTSNKGLDQTPNKGSNQILNNVLDQTLNKGSDQTSNKGLDQIHNKGSNRILNKRSDQTLKTGSDQTLKKGSDQTLNKGLEQTLNKGSAQSSSADSRKQIITSTISSKSPTKLNKNEEISINSNENCSNMTAEINIIDKKSTIHDVNVEDVATLQGNLEQSNRCPENPFEKIHSLRKKIIQTSESEDSLWCLKEMDEKQAVFEILGYSPFACYLMCVDLEFTSDIAFCTQIAFMHLKEEPDDIDELGFSLFQSLVANDIKIVPFPADELLNKLPKLVDFALSAKCLIKDVWFIAIKNEISIEISSKIPKLNIKILNKNHFSYFNVSLPINLISYPDEKIIPEVTHIEHNVIRNEVIVDAIKKVHPGKKYLFRISEAANAI